MIPSSLNVISLGCDESVTHQDGQHNILEVVPQVGGVSAEEDEVALYQLQKSEIKHSDSRPRLVCSALSLLRRVPNEATGEAADGVSQ